MKYPGALDEEIRKEENYGPEALVDGIVNMAKYKGTCPKILWILKEANWDHKAGCPPQLDDYNHRNFYKNVKCYKRWKSTFKLVIACSFGIIYKPKVMPVVDEEPLVNGINVMHNIALINVKKTAGKSASKDAEISKAYKAHRELLLKQIKQIGADVIINCSRVGELTDDLSEKLGESMEDLPIKKGNMARGFYNNEKLVIEYNHPNTRGNQTDESYYEDIMWCYKKWKELPPIKK